MNGFNLIYQQLIAMYDQIWCTGQDSSRV